MTGHPSDVLLEEVAYIAYHFHWPRHEILALTHPERRRWVEEIARLNERADGAAAEDPAWR